MDDLLRDTKEMMKGHVPSFSVINLEKYVNAGLKSSDFIELIGKLAVHIQHMMGVKAEDISTLAMYGKNGNIAEFLPIVSKLLKSLVCHHNCLTEGPIKKRLNSKRARLLLLHFLVSKAKSFEANVTPVKVDTMDKMREVMMSGAEFFVVNDEVLNSKLFQTFRAKLEKDHAKLELDLRGDGKAKKYENAAVRKDTENQGEDGMKLSKIMKINADDKQLDSMKDLVLEISYWILEFMNKIGNLKERKVEQMCKMSEQIKNEEEENLRHQLDTMFKLCRKQNEILSQTHKFLYQSVNGLKVKLEWLCKIKVIEELPFDSIKQEVEGRMKEFDGLDIELERMDIQIKMERLSLEKKFDTGAVADTQAPQGAVDGANAVAAEDDKEKPADGASVDKDARICWSCHAKEKLFKCRGCYIGWYCDMECQAADWSRHSKFCSKTPEKRRRAMRRKKRLSDTYVSFEVSEVD